MEIIGYSDRWSVRGGDTVSVHVSLARAGPFRAQLLRLVGGSRSPAGFGVRYEPAGVSGVYAGAPQTTVAGSYGRVPAAEPLFSLHRFSLCVRFCPTMPAGGKQTLVCALDETSGRGFRLSLEGAALCLEVGDGSGVVRAIAGQRRCESRRWYEARLTVGAGSVGFAVADVHGLGTETCDAEAVYAPASVDWLFGAAQGPDGTIRATFNGKLEGPVLSEEGRPVAAWDFAVDVAGDTFGDGGSGRLAGRFVNAPLRAVTASKWPSAPGGDISRDHAAVHLHEDDLDDAAWPAAFTWCLPDDLPSGVYAIRLSVGAAEDFVPLFVGSRDPARRPPVAFLVPTATYLAYANDHQAFDKLHPERGIGRPIVLQPQDLYLNEHRELGLSLYDRHADGSGVAHSSLRRPILTQRPNYRRWDGGDGHGQRWFGLDLCLVDWLIARGVPFEVVTDEVIDRDGVEALANIRVALTGSQPEYASTRMLDALGAWLGAGGRLMYLGGNGFYWRAAFPPQTPWRIELRRGHDGAGPWVSAPGESRLAATGEEGGTWRSLGRPPQALVGVGFVAEGFTRSGPYRRTDAGRLPETAFVFEGTHGDVIGDAGFSGGGAAGIELDRARGDLGTPEDAVVLARAACPSVFYSPCVLEERDPPQAAPGEERRPELGADMVMFERGGGGAVFATGSIAWIGALLWNDGDNDVSRITGNVLGRFLDPRPLDLRRSAGQERDAR